MSAGDIWSQTWVALLHGVPCASVFYMEAIDDDQGSDDELSAANAFINNVVPAIVDFQSNEIVGECLLSRRVFPTTAPARVFADTSPGGEVTGSLPSNQAIVFRHYSGIGDRFRRGRFFISGLPERDVSNGMIDEDIREKFEALMLILTEVVTESINTYRMKHFSKSLEAYFDLDSMTINPVPTKLRNRTPGICSIS